MPRYTRYRRLNPDGSEPYVRPPGVEPKATRSQHVLEWVLFSVFGILVALAAIALYYAYSPAHSRVPNHFDAGLKQDRINILLVGVGGDSHPGGGKDLADSILFVSLKPSTKQAAVISIPRDLWVRIGTHGAHRINAAHAIGNDGGYPGKGPGLLCDTVSKILNQPIHAFIRIDFAAFEKLIDDLGGIDVFVERGFYDYLFQDGFPRGPQHFDGHRALAYTRYRYVLGPEGDNFARELRQQQVINAVRDRIANRNAADMLKLINAAHALSNKTDTNLTVPQLVTLYRRYHDISRDSIRHVSLKPFSEIFEVTRLADPGQAVRPRTGDYREYQQVAQTVFNSEHEIATSDQIQVK
ncbi:MAG TPA: LCP family protein [Thermoanaerobaculia bacterium]|nr:LCP family protein [Thermoanaerobaculia bacterium]